MKILTKIAACVLMIALLTGCSTTKSSQDTTENPDAVSSASVVDNGDAFKKAISSEGTWIIAITKDVTIDEELLVEGEFKNGRQDDNGNDVLQRKIALYSQDADRNITARYTLTAPKMTITSPEASIWHGTFKGDLHISAVNFKLVDAIVDGNIYFTLEEAQSTFTMDETSQVTGTQELQ